MAYTTIDDPGLFFTAFLYPGAAGAFVAHTGVGFQPDWTWHKSRTSTGWHGVADVVRGVDADPGCKALYTNSNSAEESNTTEYLDGYQSDGFKTGENGSFGAPSNNYVAWCWKANGSGSANTAGSINTTKTSANTTSGISINTFSGTGSNATIGHGLGVAPTVILCKNRASGSDNWNWNNFSISSLGNTGRIYFNEADGNSAAAAAWNSTAPTSTLVSLGSNGENNGSSMLLYAFAPIQGFSKFGSYVGNGNADGTFVYTGFRPAWVMYKRIDGSGSWYIHDTKRNTYNPANSQLIAQEPDAEATGSSYDMDILSNGFKMRNTGGERNGSGNVISYMAFAEQPFVNSEGVPCNAR